MINADEAFLGPLRWHHADDSSLGAEICRSILRGEPNCAPGDTSRDQGV